MKQSKLPFSLLTGQENNFSSGPVEGPYWVWCRAKL